MTLTIVLTPEQEATLQAQAQAAGIDVNEYARRLLVADLTQMSGPQAEEMAAMKQGSEPDHNLTDYPLLEEKYGKLYIRGTGIKVRILAEEKRVGYTAKQIRAAHPQLTAAQINAAMDYYKSHREEMDAQMDELSRRTEELRPKERTPSRAQLEERLRQQGYVMTPDGLKKTA